MFCTSKKTMLCIKCFRDTSAEDRLHCVDLDTAYNQGAKKLERSLAVSSLTIELLPWLNFINVLHTAFTHTDPESVKFQLSHQYFFTLSGSVRVKAVLRMLMKLSPCYQNPNSVLGPIQIIRDTFSALF